jgi:hypothetical protein
VVEEDGAALLDGLHGDRRGDGFIAGAEACATKGAGLVAIGFGAKQIAVGTASPKVSCAGLKEDARLCAEGTDELAGIGALKSGTGKLEKKFLERIVRLRQVAGTRIRRMGVQWAPFASAKRLKTIELQINVRWILKLSQGNMKGSA